MFLIQGYWAPILLAAATVMTLLLAAGLRGRANIQARGSVPDADLPIDELFQLGDRALAAETLDVAAELHAALARRESLAARRLVVFDIVIQPTLVLRADPQAFLAVLCDLIDGAIGRTDSGRVLVTAIRQGSRIQITVTDDGAGTSLATLEAGLLRSTELVALHGGTLDIRTRAADGTTVTVRLPAAQSRSASAHGEADAAIVVPTARPADAPMETRASAPVVAGAH